MVNLVGTLADKLEKEGREASAPRLRIECLLVYDCSWLKFKRGFKSSARNLL